MSESSAGLGAGVLVGDWDDGDRWLELAGPVSAGELLLQVFRPTASLTDAADDYTLKLGLARPDDGDGRCWLTQMAMSAMATDEQILAALAVITHLAIECGGFLVIDGEYTPLDGVPEPPRLDRAEADAGGDGDVAGVSAAAKSQVLWRSF